MSITFTENDLILFIYGEAEPALEAEIKSALIIDKELQDLHRSLIAITNELGNARFQPQETSLKIIMEESALSQRETIY